MFTGTQYVGIASSDLWDDEGMTAGDTDELPMDFGEEYDDMKRAGPFDDEPGVPEADVAQLSLDFC